MILNFSLPLLNVRVVMESVFSQTSQNMYDPFSCTNERCDSRHDVQTEETVYDPCYVVMIVLLEIRTCGRVSEIRDENI